MAEPNAASAQVGPGTLYWAPIGTAEPATPTATLDAAWLKIGFTEKGSTFGINKTMTDLNVAEQLDPLKIVTTGRTIMLDFAMAEMTATNLSRIMNGGTIATTGPYTTYTPAVTGVETRAMMLWISDAIDEMWLWRQVIQTGNISRANNRGALALFAASFRAEIPATGSAPFEAWFLTSTRA